VRILANDLEREFGNLENENNSLVLIKFKIGLDLKKRRNK